MLDVKYTDSLEWMVNLELVTVFELFWKHYFHIIPHIEEYNDNSPI